MNARREAEAQSVAQMLHIITLIQILGGVSKYIRTILGWRRYENGRTSMLVWCAQCIRLLCTHLHFEELFLSIWCVVCITAAACMVGRLLFVVSLHPHRQKENMKKKSISLCILYVHVCMLFCFCVVVDFLDTIVLGKLLARCIVYNATRIVLDVPQWISNERIKTDKNTTFLARSGVKEKHFGNRASVKCIHCECTDVLVY